MIDTWDLGTETLPILDEASVSLARERVRTEGQRLGLPDAVIANLAIVVSELAHNQLRHARGGVIAMNELERDGVPGLELVAADRGDGLEAPASALHEHGSTGSGLGIGLAGVRRLSDELDVDVRLEEGTCIWARKFATTVPRRREVGVFGRHIRGERRSGDHAGFVRHKDSLLLALADGLGHGEGAREAAHLAMKVVRESRETPLDETLAACHEVLRGGRGAVLGLSSIDERAESADLAAAGNVSTFIVGPRNLERFAGASAALGLPGRLPRIRVTRATLRSWDTLVQFTDGLSSRATLDGDGALMREHPVVVAAHLFQTFGTDQDDALVQVAR